MAKMLYLIYRQQCVIYRCLLSHIVIQHATKGMPGEIEYFLGLFVYIQSQITFRAFYPYLRRST